MYKPSFQRAEFSVLNSDLGAQYWGGVAQNIAINACAWTTVPKKITLPPGTYILLGHATIPGNLNKLGKIRFSIENLYETSQSWYPSNDIVEINVVSFKTFTKTEEVSLEITAESSFIATSAEVAAMRIK